MKPKANPDNPAYACVVNPMIHRLFRVKPSAMPTLGIRLQSHLKEMGVELHQNVSTRMSTMLLELFCGYSQWQKVYTDGPKEGNGTGMSVVSDDHELSCRTYQL